MAELFVPQSASPMHMKPPLNPHDKYSHDLSTPMPLPTSAFPSSVKDPSTSGVFCDFDNSNTATRSSFSLPIDDPMEEISRLRQLLAEKDKHIETIEDAKVKLLKQSMENTAKLRQLESKTSPKAMMESTEFTKKLSTISAQKDSKEMICLKLNNEVKELCVQNACLKDEVSAKSSILGEYKSLIEKLEEEIEDLKQGGGKASRDREALLEKMLEEISHLNGEIDQSSREIDRLKLENSIQQEDSGKEVQYLQQLLQNEDMRRRTDDEVVVDVLGQMDNTRLSKFIFSLIKMDGKDVLDIQDLIALLESGTVSMRRRHKDAVGDDAGDHSPGGSASKTGESANLANSSGSGSGGGKITSTLDLNTEKSCIVRLMDFLNDEQLLAVGGYLKEFCHLSEEMEAAKSSPAKGMGGAQAQGGKQVVIQEEGDATMGEHVCFTITRNDGLEEVWMELTDASTNLKYYHNPDLNLTQWELPAEIQSYLNKEHDMSKD